MKKPTPEDRERRRQLDEQSERARRHMQEIMDRQEAKRRVAEERRQQPGLLRRFFPFRRAA
jgi:hypothetical protein